MIAPFDDFCLWVYVLGVQSTFGVGIVGRGIHAGGG